MSLSGGEGGPTARPDYAQRLARLASPRWKRALSVQSPYRWNLRRLRLGRTLDVGCGIGRNLAHLPRGSVGIDHNGEAVAMARSVGLEAYTTEEFSSVPAAFESLLIAHVLEHVAMPAELIRRYLPFLASGGRMVLITPQEAGYRSDPTHVRFIDDGSLRQLVNEAGGEVLRSYSFPFFRGVGHVFAHNEFVVIGRMG